MPISCRCATVERWLSVNRLRVYPIILTIWRDNDEELEPILLGSFLLHEVAPLLQDLSMVGTTGLLASITGQVSTSSANMGDAATRSTGRNKEPQSRTTSRCYETCSAVGRGQSTALTRR